MDCHFEQDKSLERFAGKLSNLSVGSVIAKGGSKFKIDTFKTNIPFEDIQKIQDIAKIEAITYSKNTDISIWVRSK